MEILQIDQKVLIWFNKTLVGHSHFLDLLLKFTGVYLIYALPIILLLMWFLVKEAKKRLALLASMTAVILSVLINKLIAHFWYRPRPDITTIGLKEVFFHRPDVSFPSDHAAVLLAITFALYLFGFKKAGNWFLLYSLIILFARVAIAIHYPLDMIGGAAVAFVAAIVIYLCRKSLTDYVYSPIISVLKKVHLA